MSSRAAATDVYQTGVASITPKMTADRGVYTMRVLSYLFVLDRIQHKGMDTHGELTAYAIGPASREEFARFVVNLLSIRARSEQAKYLRTRSRDDDSPFADWLDELFRLALHTEREGAPAVELATLPIPEDFDEPMYVVSGISLPERHRANLYGAQGSAKSWIGIHVAVFLAKCDVPVLVVDNEMNLDAELKRAHLIAGGDLPRGLFYVRSTVSLVNDEDRLRRLVTEHGIRYYVLDSLAPAVNGSQSDDEAATATLRVLDSLEIGGLVLGHVPKSVADATTDDAAPGGPIGSVFLGNLSRMNWFIRREPPDGTSTIRAGLICKKNTFGPDLPPVGIEVHFDRQSNQTRCVTIEQVEATSVSTVAGNIPIWKRMAAELRRGPMTPFALADAINESPDSVSRTARKMRDAFVVFPGKKGVQGNISLREGRHE